MNSLHHQRGFGLIVYAVLALAVLGTLAGISYKIRESGKDAVRVEWAEANRQAEAQAAKVRATREAEASKSVIALQQAERKAADYENRYRQARNASKARLAECSPTPQPATASAAAAPVASPDGGIRLTPAFVLQWDAAWTGREGRPLWPVSDPGEAAGGPAAADPVGPAQVLENHAENAFRCDAARRQLGELTALIKRLRAGSK